MLSEETHEGFRLRAARVELPLDNAKLDENTQLDLLICHLFVNKRRPVSEIVCIGVDYKRAVQALLGRAVIWDRRRNPKRASDSRERPTAA
jgi:hypothetical protein